MADVWNIVLKQALVLFCVFSVIHDVGVDARRGGGARFSGRYSRTSGVRHTGSTRMRTSWWKVGATLGAVHGLSRYQRSRRYHSNPDREPQICKNYYDYKENGTTYTMFICPMYDQPDDFNYCCGPEGRQKCCRFADDPGRLAGTIIGVLLFVGITGLIIFCCCCRRKRQPQAPKTKYTAVTTAIPATTTITTFQTAASAGPTPPTYPPQGGQPLYPIKPGEAPQAYPPQPMASPVMGADPAYPPQPNEPTPGFPNAAGAGYPAMGPGIPPPAYQPTAPGYPPGGQEMPAYPPGGQEMPAYPPAGGQEMPAYPPAGPWYPPNGSAAPYPQGPASAGVPPPYSGF